MNWLEITDGILKASVSAFGESVTYTPRTGTSKEISGIFDNSYKRLDPQSGLIVQSVEPVLGIRLSDLDSAPGDGDSVLIRSIVYRVVEVKQDGQGGATLRLHKVRSA